MSPALCMRCAYLALTEISCALEPLFLQKLVPIKRLCGVSGPALLEVPVKKSDVSVKLQQDISPWEGV